MKKIFCGLILFALMSGTCYAGENLNIVTTIFPVYDWAREITQGTEANLSMLIDSGIDLHSYNPSAADMVRIAECDLFVYVGGESDEWADDALRNITTPKRVNFNLLEKLGANVKIEEEIEGMQSESKDEEAEVDEHIWLSLRNAEIICREISEILSELDAEHSEIYRSNASSYIKKLRTLDEQYKDVMNSPARKILLFCDRFPFRYLVDDYGLKYYAAFSGCSAETEASFETVKFLTEKVNELELPYVITIEGTRHKIAETVIASTKAKAAKILVLNSMQSTTQAELKAGASYISIMESNLEILREALN